jgi:shikimate 5-dehydrogenase
VTYSQKEFASARAVAVWGGGGTLDVLRRVFPRAQFVSVRTQGLRDTGAVAAPPDVVVWAASLKDQISSPPKTWKPKVIFDLNYSEASPGRDYALQTGARYISGLAMFKAQAQAQRDFWNARWDEDGEVS